MNLRAHRLVTPPRPLYGFGASAFNWIMAVHWLMTVLVAINLFFDDFPKTLFRLAGGPPSFGPEVPVSLRLLWSEALTPSSLAPFVEARVQGHDGRLAVSCERQSVGPKSRL